MDLAAYAITSAAAWQAWKKACAAEHCPPELGAALRRFGSHRFALWVNRYRQSCAGGSVNLAALDAEHGWHLLETYCRVSVTRQGKRYKDWLFDRAPKEPSEWLAAVESGATLLMRSVAREYLRQEAGAPFATSLNRPVGAVGASGLTLEDLIPDPADPRAAIEERELKALAERFVPQFWALCSTRCRKLLWARARGCPLHDRRVLAWTRVSLRTLQQDFRHAMVELCGLLKHALPAEPPAVLTPLAALVLAETEKCADREIFLREDAARFFSKV